MAKSHDTASVALLKKIDAVCDRFEADFKAGKQPVIEKYLGAATGSERTELLRALLKLELELQSAKGQQVTQAAYEARFLDHTTVVQSVFRDRSARTTSQDTSVNKESVASARSPLPPTVDETPKQIGRFEVLQVLGQGAFGRVYKARDPQLEREVAIKVPLRGALDTPDEIDRFLREARAAATLHHPNLCPVHEVGQVDGSYFIVMAYVEGKTLSAFLKERKEPLAPKQAALILRKLALALGAAHAKGIVHRDLKPSNIMVERERKDVVIMDFGLARRRRPGDANETREGMVMGTPAYMAPEQARGDVKAVGPASDVYSLGVILYELLAGRVPFSGSVTEVIGQVLHVEPELPSKHRGGVDPQLEAICMKAMAKEPGQRYTSMKALADTLDGYLKGVPSDAITAQPKGKAKAPESSGLTDVVAALSADRKHERQAMEKAFGRRSCALVAVVVLAFGALAVLVLGGVIVLFFRTPTTIVMITLDTQKLGITEEQLKDQKLAYFLDGKVLSAKQLGQPIELKTGEHTLIAQREGVEVQRWVFVVQQSRDGNEASIAIRSKSGDYTPPKTAEPPKTDGWVSLLDERKMRDDWEGLPQHWSFKDGDLIGSSPGIKNNTFLCSKRSYKDFELKFQAKLTGANPNSGVQVRSEIVDRAKFTVKGPQLDMGDKYWGSLYGEQFGGSMKDAPQADIAKVLKPNDFNDYYIKCAGKHVTIKLNGLTTVDDDFPKMPDDGILAWQIHSGGPMEVVFRDVLLRELNDGFVSLLNGKDLTGWKHQNGAAARWKAEAGYIEVAPGQGSIITEQEFPLDFELHAEFWLPRMAKTGQGRANSGIYLLGRHEIQILDMVDNPNVKPEHGCGALYGMIAAKPGASKPPETWQTFDITFHSPRKGAGGALAPGRLTVIHNDVLVIDNAAVPAIPSPTAHNNRVGDPGSIMLQDHGAAVRFRNIRIRPLKVNASMPADAGDGFVPLFNSKDLTGWKTHPGSPGDWKVEQGAIVGRGPKKNCLYSERGDFEDLHFRIEVMINNGGNSGQQFRKAFSPGVSGDGYEVQIDSSRHAGRTGSLFVKGGVAVVPIKENLVPVDTWFTQEVIAQGNHIIVLLNGKKIVDYVDKDSTFKRGHLAFQLWEPETEVRIRRIDVKELKPAAAADGLGMTPLFAGNDFSGFTGLP